MQIGDVGSDPDALGVVPWPVANSIPRIYALLRVRAIRTQIGSPRAIARAGFRGKTLASRVGARQSAEITAMAFAGDEKGHRGIRLLLRQRRGRQERYHHRCEREIRSSLHDVFPLVLLIRCWLNGHPCLIILLILD